MIDCPLCDQKLEYCNCTKEELRELIIELEREIGVLVERIGENS